MYPEDVAVKTWANDIATFFIVQNPDFGHYCGYARFASKPLKTKGYWGIVTYAPVHGGVTYAEARDDGSIVYGFDCAHRGDQSNPLLWDLDYLTNECEAMALSLVKAAEFEEEYETASSDKVVDVINRYHASLGKYDVRFDLSDNFGAIINFLFGRP